MRKREILNALFNVVAVGLIISSLTQVSLFIYFFVMSDWNWNSAQWRWLVLAKKCPSGWNDEIEIVVDGWMDGWMMEMYQMQMEWNIETNEWRKLDFSWKSSVNKHTGRTICQRVNRVRWHGRREYVSQLSCNFVTTPPNSTFNDPSISI